MAKFKVGDKVKFKNLFKPERGEETGVVTGYDTDGSVLIRDDDGIKVKASEKLVRLANSVCNARLKVGDRVKVTWNPDGQKKGIVGKTGELLRISSEGTALIEIDGHEYFTDRAYLTLANSVRATNTKWVIYYRNGAKEKIEAPTHEAAKREADKRARKSGRGYITVIVDDGVDYGINSVRTTNAVVAKALNAVVDKKLNAIVTKAMATNAVRRKPIKKGRYSGESGDMTYYVDYTADRWFAKKYGKDGTNVTEIQIKGPYEKDSKGRDVRHILYSFALGHESIKAKDQQTRSLVEAIMRGPNVVKQGDESFAWNSQEAEPVDGVSRNASDPYLGEKLKLMLAHGAVSVSGGGKPSVGDVVFEYRGKKYYVGKDSAHMVKQFADAGLVKMVNSSDKVSANSVVAKAMNAVRNAWADAPDAATAKRDIEQTVRKATEIAKKRSGAKATYKMTPNDNFWCGYIELTFNTEEEAKKYNPYYLFDELGDNKSILPKWSWAISSFNYSKNGKVVKIFVGRLAT